MVAYANTLMKSVQKVLLMRPMKGHYFGGFFMLQYDFTSMIHLKEYFCFPVLYFDYLVGEEDRWITIYFFLT